MNECLSSPWSYITADLQTILLILSLSPLLWKAEKLKDCFASQSHPDYWAHRRILGLHALVYSLQFSKSIRNVLSLSPPTIKRESMLYPSLIPNSTVKWLIWEQNFPPNQIKQKGNAVLAVLLLETDWNRTEGLSGHSSTVWCDFHPSWLIFLNTLFQISLPHFPSVKFINNSILQNRNVDFWKFSSTERFLTYWFVALGLVLGIFLILWKHIDNSIP